MDNKNVRNDDDYGGVDSNMDLSEEDRECSILNEERKIEEDLKQAEKEDSEKDEEEQAVEWDGSEAFRVEDKDAEDYEENTTGVRITYKLEKEEIYKSLKHSKIYKKNVSMQVKHTVVQVILILLLIIASVIMKNRVYAYTAMVPLVSIIGIWILPIVSIKKLSRDMCKDKNVSIEIFPDVIEVDVNGIKSEILLDGECECEEFDGLIILNPSKGSSLIIPVRSIEPEFLPDVQAMIVSGTLPRKED